jgi:hypothetical protein
MEHALRTNEGVLKARTAEDCDPHDHRQANEHTSGLAFQTRNRAMTSIHYIETRAVRNETNRPILRVFWRIAIALESFLQGLCEGLVVYRQFEHLQSWHVPRDTALRAALGIQEPKGSRESRIGSLGRD